MNLSMSTRIVVAIALTPSLFAMKHAAAQSDPPSAPADLAAYCQTAPCRKDTVVQIQLPDGQVQEERSTLYRPPITRTSISVLLGEELRVVPEFDDETFVGWREAERRESPRIPVLTFEMTQTGRDRSVSLAISNSGREPVKLRLFTRIAGSTSEDYTSSCPVLAGGTVFEYWTQPIIEIVVRDASLLSDDAALLCD